MANDEIAEITKQIQDLKERLTEARRRRAPEPVKDYEFQNQDGSPVKLSALFGDKDDLLLVHNMGRGCVYCTMWADGFMSDAQHLEQRAAFVVVSPDEPADQRAFAESRGWTFRMASGAKSSFIRDMGYDHGENGDHDYWPGISAFHKDADGSITR